MQRLRRRLLLSIVHCLHLHDGEVLRNVSEEIPGVQKAHHACFAAHKVSQQKLNARPESREGIRGIGADIRIRRVRRSVPVDGVLFLTEVPNATALL